MKSIKRITLLLMAISYLQSFAQDGEDKSNKEKADEFVWMTEQFADLKIIRYQVPGFDQLTLNQKKLAYYLIEAGYSGRDIIWDQNYKYNLKIRAALENIVKSDYEPMAGSSEWDEFMIYVKRVWFSNGIHHHYSMNKIKPGFSRDYFEKLLKETNTKLEDEIIEVIFNPEIDAKKVNLDPEKGLIRGSAVNFYDEGMTEDQVDDFYGVSAGDESTSERPLAVGINSKLVFNEDGVIEERVWRADGMYKEAINEVIKWLNEAMTVAENDQQRLALGVLIDFYMTGELPIWDEYNVQWTKATEGDIDYINGFIEVYNDPKGYKGSFESIVEIKDFEASERMKVLSENVQWFEDNSPIMDQHKKENVVGVTYKVVNTVGEAGDASPSTPIGVNLPNSNWIRAEHGSKSVSLGNIIHAYRKAGGKGMLQEFTLTEEEFNRSDKHGDLAGKLHTALHEVVGHASGKLNKGVQTPKETLKNYSSTLEEGRADLVALYYLMDPKMVDLGLMESLEVGKAEYDSYIRNGMMLQLRRLEKGEVVEEAHMRNRQMIAMWCYEKGKPDNVIEKKVVEGKTYYVINDYDKLRDLFGQLLREVQRVKSEGDYDAGRALVENYGVQVDPKLHEEVLERAAKLNIAPYGGFINPRLVPVKNEKGEITDVKIEYPDDFTAQMLEYSEKYSFLPLEN